tara:strand:- start:64 stop:606 length:543 start_codon:yes stop_codon:yes gene_type:complete
MAKTQFHQNLFTGSAGSGFLYPESIGKVDKQFEGATIEERGVYTFKFGNSGNSDGVHYLQSGDTLLCPLMDYEFTSDMMMWFKGTNVSDTTAQLGWYGQNDNDIISSNWVTNDLDGITSAATNVNNLAWGAPRLIDFDAFNVDTTQSSMHARHTAIGMRISTNQTGGTTTLKIKIVPYRA